jgi:phosphopantothenoylcysteine decarboxylase/phosphopantothenate--cysteine ligase
LIAANDISASDAGFSVDTNRVTLIDSRGASEELPLLSKAQVAEVILARVENLLAQPGW